MDKVLHERVHRHIFISISNHLIPIDMSVGLCASVCARVRTLCAMVIMHVVANFDFIERCTRHNQFTSIEIQCKWFLMHVCLRFFFQLGIARARNALSHTNCTNNRQLLSTNSRLIPTTWKHIFTFFESTLLFFTICTDVHCPMSMSSCRCQTLSTEPES